MKKISVLLSLLSLAFVAPQLHALNWIWAGSAPWVYDDDSQQWYYLASYQDAVWMFGENDSIELAPANGNAPYSVADQSMVFVEAFEAGRIDFNSDGTFTEVTVDGSNSGTYSYSKTGDNTAIAFLLYNDGSGEIVALNIDWGSDSSGTATGRTTDTGGTEDIEAAFTLE